MEAKEREKLFWKKVNKDGPVFEDKGPCWLWLASKTGEGYGQFWGGGGATLAHQYVYELLVGEIPVGFDLHHLCPRRACVSPIHLELLTHKDHASGENNGNAKLTEQEVLSIRKLYAEGKCTQLQLATQFGVSNPQISAIISGECWDHIPIQPLQNNQPQGEKHGRAKLTEKEVVSIRELYAGGKCTQLQLAERFNVHKTQISGIITGRYWSHISLQPPQDTK